MVAGSTGDETDGDETHGKGDVGENAEERVGGERALTLEGEQEKGDGDGGKGSAQRGARAHEEAQAHAKQARMGEGLAEIGHPPPDDEAADGTGDESNPDAGQEGAVEEGLGKNFKHGHPPSFRLDREG